MADELEEDHPHKFLWKRGREFCWECWKSNEEIALEQQLAQARALLENLLHFDDGIPFKGRLVCCLCRQPENHAAQVRGLHFDHTPDCPWLEARAFLARKE